MFRSLQHIDWHQFHFLRPAALWLFVPVLFVLLLVLIGSKENSKWKKIIAPALRPFMFGKGSRWAFALPVIIFVMGVSAAIIGLAGPAWHKTKVPGQKISAVLLIVMDLSKSMLATDIPPSRLERAKLKVGDLLRANPRADVGLMAFAGTPHLVLPFTGDYDLIKLHAATLQNRIMPVQGHNTALLIKAIDTIMSAQLAPGTVLLITDAISVTEASQLSDYVNERVHRLEVLLVAGNGQASAGRAAMPVQDEAVLQNLRQHKKITITPITLDTTDVGGSAKRIRDTLVFKKDDKRSANDWDDMGYLLIIPAMLCSLLWFRKGWGIQWCWILPFLLLQACTVKSKEAGWWYTKDYQGQVLYNEHAYADAAKRFKDLTHKAAAAYKAGDYEAAASLFALDSSAAGHYNRGLALARLGRYDEAVADFRLAQQLDNALRDKTGKSIQQVTKAHIQLDSMAGLQQKNTALKEHKKDGPLKERKRQPMDPSLSADTKVKDEPKTGDRRTDEAQSNIHQAKEGSAPSPKDTTSSDGQTMNNIVFHKAPADPSAFLQKRFELQRKKYFPNVKPDKDLW